VRKKDALGPTVLTNARLRATARSSLPRRAPFPRPRRQADLHFRATGTENWAPLLLFVGFLGVVVVAARAHTHTHRLNSPPPCVITHTLPASGRAPPAQTLVYACLQHHASLEAAESAERVARYRAATAAALYRGDHSGGAANGGGLSYDGRTHIAKGLPMYGACESTIYTATVSPHSFLLRRESSGGGGSGGGDAATHAAFLPAGGAPPGGVFASSGSPRRERHGGGGGSSNGGSAPSSPAAPLPSVISVGADGVSAGVPAYTEHALPVQVIPAFRWEPLRPLPGGAPWVPATTAGGAGGGGGTQPAGAGGASIGGWGAGGGGARRGAAAAAAARAALEGTAMQTMAAGAGAGGGGSPASPASPASRAAASSASPHGARDSPRARAAAAAGAAPARAAAVANAASAASSSPQRPLPLHAGPMPPPPPVSVLPGLPPLRSTQLPAAAAPPISVGVAGQRREWRTSNGGGGSGSGGNLAAMAATSPLGGGGGSPGAPPAVTGAAMAAARARRAA
jgi:hypothetical protein